MTQAPSVSTPRQPSIQPNGNAGTDMYSTGDLKLLHHWILVTSLTITPVPSFTHLWQTTVLEIGYEHQYILHAIFSITALHKAVVDRDLNLLEPAITHHNHALSSFRAVVPSFGARDAEAAFIFSILNALYVFALNGPASALREDAFCHQKSGIELDWIPVVRGIDAVLRPHFDHVYTGRLRQLITVDGWHECDPDDEGAHPAVGWLKSLHVLWSGMDAAAVYDKACILLRRSFILAEHNLDQQLQHPPTISYQSIACPMVWVHFVSDEYLNHLQNGHPPALAILAYFGALVHTLDHIWPMRHCGQRIVQRVINADLSEVWLNAVRWPLDAVGLS